MPLAGLFVLATVFIPSYSALACAVCFGKGDNPNLGRAYNLGIFFLLGFIFFILAALGFAIYRIEQRRGEHESKADV